MTAIERISLVTIASWILGGGLIWSLANLIYTDFIKQPYFDISINFDNSTKNATLTFKNVGAAAARNIRMTITSSSAEMPDPSLIFGHEEVKFYNNNQAKEIVANISRLVPQDELSIAIPLKFAQEQRITFCNVTFTYNDRLQHLAATIKADEEYFDVHLGRDSLINSTITLLVVAMVIIIILIFQISVFYRVATKDFIARSYCSKIKGEIKSVYTILKNENNQISYKDIFLTDGWDSKSNNIKQKIFYNYEDFKKISDFYKQLRIRDFTLFHYPINNERLKLQNILCYEKAKDALTVSWQKYDLNLHSILTLIGRLLFPYWDLVRRHLKLPRKDRLTK